MADENINLKSIAEELLGIPYEHNGRDKEGLDCWGLVYLFFKKLGVELPTGDGKYISDEWYKIEPERYEKELAGLGEEVGHFKHLQPLDIPYFRLYQDVVTHTGVMLDDTHFIHVLIDKEVRIDTMKRRFWRAKYAGARRLNNIKIF